jgi:ABC-2 type transport system permease protein
MAYQMGMLSSFLPAFMLSGFIYALGNMPHAIQVISYAVPARYFVAIVNGVFLKGVGWEMLWVQAALLVLYAAIVFWAAVRKMRMKVA